jgi:CPA2 family monovalent cation:H+ antiporter-2
MEGFLFQATIFLAAAVIAVPIAARLGLGQCSDTSPRGS